MRYIIRENSATNHNHPLYFHEYSNSLGASVWYTKERAKKYKTKIIANIVAKRYDGIVEEID